MRGFAALTHLWGAAMPCRSGPELGHDQVVHGSLKDQLEWIIGRFAGEH